MAVISALLGIGLLIKYAPHSLHVNPKDGAEMVQVPAGEFLMGSSPGEGDDDEQPQHTVYLDSYYIYKNDVTVAQYRKFCGATGRQLPAAPSWGWHDDHPVVNVTWFDAQAYAAWAGVALPTEAEWEKAARGTDGRRYPWGNDWDTTKCINSDNSRGLSHTQPVGSCPAGASPYGALDMAGNVFNWCADWYQWDYYMISSRSYPTGPATGDYRILRGGSWYRSNPGDFCATYRVSDDPQFSSASLGFRCVSHSAGP